MPSERPARRRSAQQNVPEINEEESRTRDTLYQEVPSLKNAPAANFNVEEIPKISLEDIEKFQEFSVYRQVPPTAPSTPAKPVLCAENEEKNLDEQKAVKKDENVANPAVVFDFRSKPGKQGRNKSRKQSTLSSTVRDIPEITPEDISSFDDFLVNRHGTSSSTEIESTENKEVSKKNEESFDGGRATAICTDDNGNTMSSPVDSVRSSTEVILDENQLKNEDLISLTEEEPSTSAGNEDVSASIATGTTPSMVPIEAEAIHPDLLAARCAVISELIDWHYEHYKLQEKELHQAWKYVHGLERDLQPFFGPISLSLYGSTVNGFGTFESDMDVCFRFRNPPKNINAPEVVRRLSIALWTLGIINMAIPSAKVPVVKCCNEFTIDMDICYNNSLAFYNSHLLATYCKWEPKRLPQLGMWVKKWARICSISDSPQAYLSPYAFVILVIHYLQNCSPPVLPHLQEDYRQMDQEAELHQGCDVYFHKEVQENWSENKQSTGELFIGFLEYYSKFDWNNQVVQIRRKEPMTKTYKRWEGKPMAIEDPLELGHNLGLKLTEQRFYRTCASFSKAYEIFTTTDIWSEWDKEHCSYNTVEVNLLKRCRVPNEVEERPQRRGRKTKEERMERRERRREQRLRFMEDTSKNSGIPVEELQKMENKNKKKKTGKWQKTSSAAATTLPQPPRQTA